MTFTDEIKITIFQARKLKIGELKMSEPVETVERPVEKLPLFKQGWIYLPGGTVCHDFDEAVLRMYDVGYSLAAMKLWFSKYGAKYEDIIQALINAHLNPFRLGFGTFRIRQGDIEWLDKTLYDMHGVGSVLEEKLDIGIMSHEEETALAEEAGLIVPENPDVPKTLKNQVEQLVEDPLPVFKQMNTYTLMIAQGLSTALLITGQGGIGKSYNVTRILNAYGKKGKDYVVMKGRSTIAAMYKFLYDNYDKTVVFDDCDSVLQDNDGLNILKGVLDTGEIREVSWNNSRTVNTFGCETHAEIDAVLEKYAKEHKKIKADLIPNYFRFMGSCIFISNLSAADLLKSPAMAPLLTRCNTVDIQLTPDEVITKMEVALPGMHIYDAHGKDITREDLKQEVFAYIKSPEFLTDPRLAGKQISFRIFHQAYKFRYAGFPNWKDLSFCV